MKWNFLLWITAVLSLLYKCKFTFRRFFPGREVDHIKEKTQSNFCRFLMQRLFICQNVLCSYNGQLLLQLTQSVLSFHWFRFVFQVKQQRNFGCEYFDLQVQLSCSLLFLRMKYVSPQPSRLVLGLSPNQVSVVGSRRLLWGIRAKFGYFPLNCC